MTHAIGLEFKDAVVSELNWEPSINAAEIAVATTNDGIVTLSGRVLNYWERIAAERAAERVEGVIAAVNELEVRLPNDGFPDVLFSIYPTCRSRFQEIAATRSDGEFPPTVRRYVDAKPLITVVRLIRGAVTDGVLMADVCRDGFAHVHDFRPGARKIDLASCLLSEFF